MALPPPRALFVGRGRLRLPLEPWLAKKWDAVAQVLELRVLNAGTGTGDVRFRLLPEPAAPFYAALAPAIASELRGFRPDVVVAADPFVGAAALTARAVVRSPAKVIVEVHGDPATFTRAYGSSLRRTLSALADGVAKTAIRRADATRALSAFTSSIVEAARGEPATACFPTWSDLDAFERPALVPVPSDQRIVFIGALERYKNIDGLASAWRRVPHGVLVIVGDGSRRDVVERLLADLPGRVVHHPRLTPEEVAAELDAARALVLPSWPEGLGRVVLEAFARGRAVVGTDGGGIPDMATDGHDSLLVPPYDEAALVAALERVLVDHDLAVRLGGAARESYAPWHQTPEDFAGAYRELVDRTLAGAR
jgi:glycosyltransferase involved in cell wall biosynthesis